MACHVFGAIVDIESGPVQIPDPPGLRKPDDVVFPTSTPLELDDLTWSAKQNGPLAGIDTLNPATTPHSGSQTPKTPVDFFSSHPASPGRHEAANLVQSWSDPPMSKWRVLSCCLMYFGNGMNDSAPGALIPYIETHYSIGYAIVSLIFVSQAIGFIAAAFFTETMKGRIGQAKSLIFSELLMVVSFVGLVCAPPFPVVVCLFFFLGWAMAINLALNNVFCANLDHSTVILGAAHGAYGVGGVVGPIIATTLVSHGAIWSRYYAIPLGICLLGAVLAGWAFRGYEQETPALLLSSLERTASQREALEVSQPSKRKLLVQALKYSVTLIGALFTFAYQGAEVSISGWVISFLITVRHGDPAHVGYVTAGFWGGITLGRFTLAHAAARLGEKRFVFGLGGSAIVFQLLVWLLPNIIGDSIAVAMVGYVLGPVAPCSMVMFMRLLPRSIQTTSVSFISSAGSSGGALAPFLTGLLAQAVGTFVLHPICIALFVVMLGCWWLLPAVEKRTE